MKHNDLINTLIIMAGVESKQAGSMPMEDNLLFLAANKLKDVQQFRVEILAMAEFISEHADSGRLTWLQATQLTGIAERLEAIANEM